MWQTKYASAVPKNLGLGLNFCRLFPVWVSVLRAAVDVVANMYCYAGIAEGQKNWGFQL